LSQEKKSNGDGASFASKGLHGSIERQLTLLTLLANLIPSSLVVFLLFYFEVSAYLIGIVVFLLLFLTLYCVSSVWRQSQYQFRSLHNLLEAIVQGDYSFRGSRRFGDSAFGALISTINDLANTLYKQRLKSEESQLLVKKVVDQIDVAIIAWDQRQTIQLINPAARRLLNFPEDQLGKLLLPPLLDFANELKVGETQVQELQFQEVRGRYRLHLERFITDGDTHNLLFLTNLSSILRLEERRAWRNLVRVLSHEINNSLSPLKSFSATLNTQIQKRETDAELKRELTEGMNIIGHRADSLAKFVQRYYEIAKLPEPDRKATDFQQCLAGLSKLFPGNEIRFEGKQVTLAIDQAQIEQVIINLIKNAVEAAASGSLVEVQWLAHGSALVVRVIDNGSGIQNIENIFTPFYTTKASGSGIGLVLCQQIVEAHDGDLSLANRQDGQGCVATIRLPLAV
tara:strand:- start:1433 stop:2800 length:1368 start_codon:yes stop_codon:yes gene_type:complete